MGAVVVKDGQVVGEGFNRRESTQDPLSHAEIHAIQSAAQSLGAWRLLGCTLYVSLEPCPLCLAACQQARVERVVYGARDPKGGAISLGYRLHEDERMHHRFLVEAVEFPESEKMLKDFFKQMREEKKNGA